MLKAVQLHAFPVRSRSRSGFSIVELMVAMLIFTTSLLAVYGMFPMAFKAIARGNVMIQCTEIARKELEYLKSIRFDDLDNNNILVRDRPDVNLDTEVNGVRRRSTYRTLVDVVPNYNGDPNMKLIVVEVKDNSSDLQSAPTRTRMHLVVTR